MFRSLIFTVLAAAAAGQADLGTTVANDDGVNPADRAAIMVAIRRVVDSLRKGSAAAAFRSLTLPYQQKVGGPLQFLKLVKEDFKPLCRARFVNFDTLSLKDGRITQQLNLIGADGQTCVAYFVMEPDEVFNWKIADCIIDEDAEVSDFALTAAVV